MWCWYEKHPYTGRRKGILFDNNNLSDGGTGQTKKHRECRLQSKNSQRYHAKYKERRVTELWITMIWAGAGTAPRAVLPESSCAIHIHDITARWSGMTQQTVRCTNSTCRKQNTVPLQHGITNFMALSINIMVCPLPSSGKLRREKQFHIGKRAIQKHSAFNRWGWGALCWYSAYPVSHSNLLFYPFIQKQNFPPKSYQLPHKIHGVIHQKTIIFDAILNCISEKKRTMRRALDSFDSG